MTKEEGLILELTADGSHTLYVPHLDERYHSGFGAVQESLHIFIRNGFRFAMRKKTNLNILEVGFGTGLNALLTCIDAGYFKIKTTYTAIEPYPLPGEIIRELNYTSIIEKRSSDKIFQNLHETEWNAAVKITDDFAILKIKERIEDIELKDNTFNLVYFDAFSPGVQPELWEKGIFTKIFTAMAGDGILLTYSAKGSVKRNLAHGGFKVENIPGPPGKREITRAIKEFGKEI